jgi:hypothetical protein
LLNKGEKDLEHEIKIVQTTSNIINTNFRLQKCNKICLKKVHTTTYTGNTIENCRKGPEESMQTSRGRTVIRQGIRIRSKSCRGNT